MSNKSSKASQWILGAVMLCAGAAITGVGAQVIPVDPATVHAPYWVIVLCGLVFMAGGMAAVIGEKHPLNGVLAAIIALGLAASFAWVTLFGDSEHMSGGVWFLPQSVNDILGRILFGLGSIMGFVIGGLALFGRRGKARTGSGND
ncbi:MAG: hypothetical protein KJO98_15635 [Rhodothermia bacterium]|nr:hypothetical protein [Rhodothermia bacterium]